ncbi:efflux RND transporter periplasmic adaptor subunit [Vibrio hangzhouensis]|uniref:RND family efflux transporter, MFP subunit n=1 Tax=Vibrio hangzhouensis TaxID=462991 RepID=A0A1H5TMU2_9VIBR|nr:efflux RND transporter periplasmic adaptor subunit [Vibrio hangzhouensis]SEF64093.1 RND family efflux transporter, MFP subunit [Vibrio hangzhouensis]
MIAFLTLCYIALLFILYKLGIIRLTLWWKLSPIAWKLLLVIALLIPMQWGAPSGTVNVYQKVLEVVPEVTGRVNTINVAPNQFVRSGDTLFSIDDELYRYRLASLEAQLELAKSNLARSQELMLHKHASQASVDQYSSEVKTLTAQIDEARYNLEHTNVKAPTDGYVTGLSLVEGQRVSNLPMRSWMSFVAADSHQVVMGVNQNTLRYVEPGQSVEATFKLYPGVIFEGKVESIVPITNQGQLSPSGSVPFAPNAQSVPQQYGVVLTLDTEQLAIYSLEQTIPSNAFSGAIGTASIYTETGKFTHIVRKVMLRMDAWLNFILPA